jgi:hypothetical protein
MGVVLRTAAILATIVGLAAFGLALGDFASHPNPLGAIGLVVLVVLGGAAIRQLFGPGPRPKPEPPTEPEPPRRKRPAQRATSAPLWLDDDASR